MAVLVLLNGAPGVGKSTLARRYAEERPLSVVLDIDVVRSMVGGWRRDPLAAGLLARKVALSALGAALDEGHDVLVPQLLAAADYVEELAAAARDHDASFVEVLITTSPETAIARYEARALGGREDLQVADPSQDPRHVIPRYRDAIQALTAGRPQTLVLANDEGEHPYPLLVAAVEGARRDLCQMAERRLAPLTSATRPASGPDAVVPEP